MLTSTNAIMTFAQNTPYVKIHQVLSRAIAKPAFTVTDLYAMISMNVSTNMIVTVMRPVKTLLEVTLVNAMLDSLGMERVVFRIQTCVKL